MSKSFDLAVAYRIYPRVAKPAIGLPLSDNKLRMAEACLHSFRESLGELNAKIWVLLDGCPPEYEELFCRYFDESQLVLIPLDGIGNQRTFEKQIEILLRQTDAEHVYFAEDDYFYLPGQFRVMMDFLRSHADVDFVSPYDHTDCYQLELHRHPQWLRVSAGHHWRTSGSTCLTFLTSRSTLRKTEQVFRTYGRGNSDSALWLSLTKYGLWDPAFFARCVMQEPRLGKIILKSWIFGWTQILFRRSRTLWVPVPGIATHMDAHALSPSVGWESVIEQQVVSKARTFISSHSQKA